MLEKEYAKAIFYLSEEEGTLEKTKSDIECVLAALTENQSYTQLLDTPALPISEKLSLIDEAFSALSQNVLNLIKILCEKHIVHSFFKVAREFEALYNEKMGIEKAEAITAVEMTGEQLEKLRVRLEALTGKKIVINNTVDASIIGGVKLRYMGKQLDSSLKTRLSRLEEGLRETII